MRINRRQIQIYLTAIFIILGGATAAFTQEITPNQKDGSVKISRSIQPAADDECSQILDKTLDAFEKLQKAKADVDAELITNKDLRAKEEAYNDELLKAVALLTSSEKRNKSFFQKLRQQMGRVLMTATDTKTLTSIVSIILILDRLKK